MFAVSYMNKFQKTYDHLHEKEKKIILLYKVNGGKEGINKGI